MYSGSASGLVSQSVEVISYHDIFHCFLHALVLSKVLWLPYDGVAYGMGPVQTVHSTRTSTMEIASEAWCGIHEAAGCCCSIGNEPRPGPTSPPGTCWRSSSRILSRSPARISTGSSCWLAEHQEVSWLNALKQSESMIYLK